MGTHFVSANLHSSLHCIILDDKNMHRVLAWLRGLLAEPHAQRQITVLAMVLLVLIWVFEMFQNIQCVLQKC